MRFFITVITFIVFLFGSVSKDDVYDAYRSGDYKKACWLAAKIYLSYKKDSDFLNIFANSCLKSDNINRMAFAAMLLIRDSAARSNSIYYLTILYQKKLLYKSLIDGFDLSNYNFPTTDYIFSKIFVKYAEKKYKKDKDVYVFEDDNNKEKRYKMSLTKENGVYKIILKTYINQKLIKTRVYW